MSEYTLSQMRGLLDASCFPPSATPAGMNALINKAREAIYNSYDSNGGTIWLGTEVPFSLAIITQPDASKTVTLPRHLETIQGVYGTNSGIVSPRNQWFSYLRVPPNRQAGSSNLDDLGDGYCGVIDPVSTGQYLKITTTATEASGLTVSVYGTGTDGNATSCVISVPTVSGNSATGSVLFTAISEVVISVTAGVVNAYLTDNTTDVFFARYEAGETMANYRRYKLAFSTTDTVLKAICKRRFQPLAADNDPVDICNLLAMECALKAYKYLQSSDLKVYKENMMIAIGYLNGELSRHESDSEQVTVQFEPALMMGRVSNFP